MATRKVTPSAGGERYVAFLRGVMPTNANMPALRAAFEAAGFTDVKTVLGSGNLVFSAPRASESTLERRAEAAMEAELGRTFPTWVRPRAALEELLRADPFSAFDLAPNEKRVVTFLRAVPRSVPTLPIEREGARLHALRGRELLVTYTPLPKGPVFMALIEKTFGKDVTTRTWDTVAKCVK